MANPNRDKGETKDLSEMTSAEPWALFPIVLKKHNPEYVDWYDDEEENLQSLLAEYEIFRINHIGSTAVSGLVAKPIVDILLEMDGDYDANAIIAILETNGWLVMARNDSEQTVGLNKGYTKAGFAEKVFHLHIKPKGAHGELYFRDYLREHDKVARAYGRLKLKLKKQYEHDRDGYTDAKTDFITKHTELARREIGDWYSPEPEEKTIFNWRKYETVFCPKCGSGKVAKILYGWPDCSDEMKKKLKSKVIVLGGCCMSKDSPVYECTVCHKEWGRLYDESEKERRLFDRLKRIGRRRERWLAEKNRNNAAGEQSESTKQTQSPGA